MAQIDTSIGMIDAKLLDLRSSPIDDEKRYGARIEVWAKPAAELLQMAWEIGEAAHPNCGRGDAKSMHCLNDTVDQATGTLGAGTMIVTREEFHPPNCMVSKLVRAQRVEPLAVYEQVSWTKENPFEETPDEVEIDNGDGAIVMAPTSTLTKTVTKAEDENRFMHAVEYRNADGKVVKRSVDMKLKHSSATAAMSAAGF